VNYKLSKDNIVTANVDVFNIFNFQQVALVDETFTTSTVTPIPNGTPADAEAIKSTVSNPNPNFLKPTAYQSPRSIRFGVKVTF